MPTTMSSAQQTRKRRLTAYRSSAPKRPEAYDFSITRLESFGNSQNPIPSQVTLLRPNPQDPTQDQLFIDQQPIPSEAWKYDPTDQILTWKGLFGGGHLFCSRNRSETLGTIGSDINLCSVKVSVRSQFLCDVALNTGASYISAGSKLIGLSWDTSSDNWKNAQWQTKRLLLAYVSTSGGDSPSRIAWSFTDQLTQAPTWTPDPGDYTSLLELSPSDMSFHLDFHYMAPPEIIPPDGSNAPTSGPDTVFPTWLQAKEDAAVQTINGVLEIDLGDDTNQGTLVGFQGERYFPALTGYYQTSPQAAPLGIFAGSLTLDGKPIGNSYLRGQVLHWSGLTTEQQKRTGLAESGSLNFSPDGSIANGPQADLSLRRLSVTDSLKEIAAHQDIHPTLYQQSSLLHQTLAQTTLQPIDLLAMHSIVKNTQGQWEDVIQTAVRQDMSTIMNSYVPSDLWTLLFPNQTQQPLTNELAQVVNIPVPGVTDPKSWYQSLATAVLSSGMANGSDSNCKNLNGPRAATWLQTQITNSPVYHNHGQALFQQHWQTLNPTIQQFFDDQNTNADTYATEVDQWVKDAIADINQNVTADASDPNLLTDLISEVQAVGDYAKNNGLYWAFKLYKYVTNPSLLGNIALVYNDPTQDPTSLARMFQENTAIFTALDPSGYFAQQYTKTLNIFLATNILPSMFGFNGDVMDFDVIKMYLQKFVDNNINSENQQIQDTVNSIKGILEAKDADIQLQKWIDALHSCAAGTANLQLLSYNFSRWFSESYSTLANVADKICGVFIGGVVGLGINSLFFGFKDWEKIKQDPEQLAQLILTATQFGVQILTAMITRGVRIYAIFQVNGLSGMQRFASVGKIMAANDAAGLEDGLVKISNSFARWLGDTTGTVGKEDPDALFFVDENGDKLLFGAEDSGTWLTKVFGENLEEFAATRLGSLFVLAGIGVSIYAIIKGEKDKIALANDSLNIASGSLALMGTVAEWALPAEAAVEEGGVAAIAATGLTGFISVAGPLAILAAIAGIGLMLYELFKPDTAPDPVQTFVNQYAQPAGFAVTSQASSIDYTFPYLSPNKNDPNAILMTGFSLAIGDQALKCNFDGSITLETKTPIPNFVWQAKTDGLGMSKLYVVVEPDITKPSVALCLSLMSDNTVSFQPPMVVSSSAPDNSTVTVTTQTWLSHPQGNATVNSDGNLVSLGFTFQPVLPDTQGNYAPSQASGWLSQSDAGIGIDPSQGTTYTLVMCGMGVFDVQMRDVNITLNTTPAGNYGPHFNIQPSTPLTFDLAGDALPAFFSFDQNTGIFSANGQKATTALTVQPQLTVSNALGSATTTFKITVAASPPLPTV